MGTRHKDEEDAKCHSDGGEHEKGHCGPRPEQPCNKGLSDSRPVHERVFAETEERHYQVQLVLVADQEIGTNRERKDEL